VQEFDTVASELRGSDPMKTPTRSFRQRYRSFVRDYKARMLDGREVLRQVAWHSKRITEAQRQ
jgi:hypothetical protein